MQGVRYTPTANYNGPDAFTYTILDGNGGTATATVNVTVTPVNDPPVAVLDTTSVAEDSVANVIPVLANDTMGPDTGETLAVTAVTQPAHGTATLTAGAVHYSPATDYAGPDTFTYTLSDGLGGTATGTVNVTVTAANDNPTANNDTAPALLEDAVATVINVLGNDSSSPDTGETLTVTDVGTATHGTTSLVSGVVRYQPAPTTTARTPSSTRSATGTAAPRRPPSPSPSRPSTMPSASPRARTRRSSRTPARRRSAWATAIWRRSGGRGRPGADLHGHQRQQRPVQRPAGDRRQRAR